MGPITRAAARGLSRGGQGRGVPSPLLGLQRPSGDGAPSPGEGKGKGKAGPSYRDAAAHPRRPSASTQVRTVAPVRVVKERPAGEPGAGPSWARDPPGPNHWWDEVGWVRWEPAQRGETRAAEVHVPQPQARNHRYEVLLWGPAGARASLGDGTLAATLRGAALAMGGFDVYPALLAVATTAKARWEGDHIRLTLTQPTAPTKRIFTAKPTAVAAALHAYLPRGDDRQRLWRAVLLLDNRQLTKPKYTQPTAKREPLALGNRFKWFEDRIG